MQDAYIDLQGILALKLPNVSSRLATLREMAQKNGWVSRKRAGRGGGLEYAISSLPPPIREAIQHKQAQALLQAGSAALPTAQAKQTAHKPVVLNKKMRQLNLLPIEAQLKSLNDKQLQVAHARAALVAYVQHLHTVIGLPVKQAVAMVVQEAQTGHLADDLVRLLPLANARNNDNRLLSSSTLYNWVRSWQAAGDDRNKRLLALAPQQTKPKRDLLTIAWLPEFLGIYQDWRGISMIEAYRRFARLYEQSGRLDALPSLDQVEYVMRQVPKIVKERGRKTGSAYRNLLPYVQRDWLALKPNDVWIGDGHSFKAKVQHPIHGKPFVPEFTAIIDGCTAMVVGWTVSLAENTVAVAEALRGGMAQHGVPLLYYSDNGAGQTAKLLDHDITGILPRLGIEHATGIAGNPQGRARIERLWQHTAIALAQEYGTYQGKSADHEAVRQRTVALTSAFRAIDAGRELTASQQKAKNALPTWAQFWADLGAMVEDYNEHHEHSKLPKDPNTGRHYTPAAYYRHRIQADQVAIERLTELELDYLWLPEEIRTVQRGMVQLFNNSYFSMELAIHHGEQVRVAYDLHRAQTVLVKNMDGTIICKAQFEGNKVAAFAQTRIEQLAEQRKQRKVKKAMAQIALAQAEARPALEHQPDFGQLIPTQSPTRETEYVLWQNEQDNEPPQKIYAVI